MTGMQCADGEIKAARAAEKFGVPFTLSTMSIVHEDVAENTTAPFGFSDTMRTRICVTSDQTGKGREMFGLVITLDQKFWVSGIRI